QRHVMNETRPDAPIQPQQRDRREQVADRIAAEHRQRKTVPRETVTFDLGHVIAGRRRDVHLISGVARRARNRKAMRQEPPRVIEHHDDAWCAHDFRRARKRVYATSARDTTKSATPRRRPAYAVEMVSKSVIAAR